MKLLPFALALGCAGDKTVETGGGNGTLPDETGAPEIVYDTSTYQIDTGVPSDTSNEEPDTVLHMEQTGEWMLSPAGGPYTAVVGTLSVLETLDEGFVNCEAVYDISGSASDETCEGCEVAFDVLFRFREGNTANCRDVDLPDVDEVRTFGWARDEATLYLNYYNSGAWVPWYDATLEGDTLSVSWVADIGVAEGA